MKKRIVVAGCRNFNNYEVVEDYISKCIEKIKEEHQLIFVSGGCSGVDKMGERFASANGYKTEIYPAEWDKYGRAAGPKRNMKMAEIADYVICFWDGKSSGTKSMIEYAKKNNKPLRIKYIELN